MNKWNNIEMNIWDKTLGNLLRKSRHEISAENINKSLNMLLYEALEISWNEVYLKIRNKMHEAYDE